MNSALETYIQASAKLDYVNEELNRPEEDVMTFAICHQTRSVISELFQTFLIYKGTDFSSANDIESLRSLCVKLNPGFATIDIQSMSCYPGNIIGEEGYCMDLSRVKDCLNIANQLKLMVVQAVPGLG